MAKQDFLDGYVEVNVRIDQFWEKYPDGRISTTLLKWEDGVVMMRADIYKHLEDERPAATGHAYEKEGSTYINKTSAVENCETSAVGRALGIMGFEIKKAVASREEVQNAQAQQREDRPRTEHARAPSGSQKPASSGATLRGVFAAGKAAGLTEDAIKETAYNKFEIDSMNDMTEEQRAELAQYFRDLAKERAKEAKSA